MLEKFFGKIWMVRDGLWNDVDVNISWHPSAVTESDVQSTLALVDFKVEFGRLKKNNIETPGS